jgi:hypothetical protein
MQNSTLAKSLAALTVLIFLPEIALHYLNPALTGNSSAPVSIAPMNHLNPPQNRPQ